MYHYLKWAALSLFLKRNTRYLLLIAISIVGIYVSDALYEDMADLLAKSGKSDEIAKYLLMKWMSVLLFASIAVWSFLRIGFANRGKKDKKIENSIPETDPYLKRLEKFKTGEKLRSKSEILIEKQKREKKSKA